jgi:hypothetical protein
MVVIVWSVREEGKGSGELLPSVESHGEQTSGMEYVFSRSQWQEAEE